MHAEKTPIQFNDKGTFIHLIHPITKLFWMVILTGILIIYKSFIFSIILLALILGLFYLSGFNVLKIKGIKIILSTSVFIALLQVFFNTNGQQLFSIFGVNVTTLGIEDGIYLGSRFCSIILVGFLFILTTNPNSLIYSLMQAGIPYRMGFSLISALRLMTIFSGESEKIYYSSIIKGSSYSLFSIREFFKTLTNYFKLLFVSIFEKVDALVISMEGRGFGNRNKRTFLESRPLKWADFILIIFGCLIFLGIILF